MALLGLPGLCGLWLAPPVVLCHPRCFSWPIGCATPSRGLSFSSRNLGLAQRKLRSWLLANPLSPPPTTGSYLLNACYVGGITLITNDMIIRGREAPMKSTIIIMWPGLLCRSTLLNMGEKEVRESFSERVMFGRQCFQRQLGISHVEKRKKGGRHYSVGGGHVQKPGGIS